MWCVCVWDMCLQCVVCTGGSLKTSTDKCSLPRWERIASSSFSQMTNIFYSLNTFWVALCIFFTVFMHSRLFC